jgi:hypothetical protein
MEIEAEDVRGRALERLDRLDGCRRDVARAAGDPEALGAALERLDHEFEAATGQSSIRHPGQTYGGRQLVYEDCRRGIEVELGGDILARIAPACGLLLQSARWYTFEIARRYRAALGEIYDRVGGETGQPALELRRFWASAQALFPGGSARDSIVWQVAERLRRAWADLFAIAGAAGRVDRAVEPLRARVAAAFAAPAPGWPNARYQSLDLMIAAAGRAALCRGEYLVVLGELHAGMNTVLSPVFCKEYPALEELLAWRADDLVAPCIAPVWSFQRSRADYFSMVPIDLALEQGAARSWRPRDHVVAESEWVIERQAGQLEVRTRDGRHRFDVIAFFEHHLIAESHAHFQLAGPAPRSPRLTLDGLVLARETWRMTPAEVAPAHADSPEARFLAAQAWARRHGLPRRVFVKVPEETKPFFVDLASSLSIDNFAKIARRSSAVTVSEMLPALDELWLVDAQGQTYTSELRLVAVDPVPFGGAREDGRS